MKTTKKYIQKIIREELNKVLNETMSSQAHDKLVNLITTGKEGLNQALELFSQIKGMGMLQPSEEEYIEKLSDFADAAYKYASVVEELRLIRKKFGAKVNLGKVFEKDNKRRKHLIAVRKLQKDINPKDRSAIAQATVEAYPYARALRKYITEVE